MRSYPLIANRCLSSKILFLPTWNRFIRIFISYSTNTHLKTNYLLKCLLIYQYLKPITQSCLPRTIPNSIPILLFQPLKSVIGNYVHSLSLLLDKSEFKITVKILHLNGSQIFSSQLPQFKIPLQIMQNIILIWEIICKTLALIKQMVENPLLLRLVRNSQLILRKNLAMMILA